MADTSRQPSSLTEKARSSSERVTKATQQNSLKSKSLLKPRSCLFWQVSDHGEGLDLLHGRPSAPQLLPLTLLQVSSDPFPEHPLFAILHSPETVLMSPLGTQGLGTYSFRDPARPRRQTSHTNMGVPPLLGQGSSNVIKPER